jgi:threonine dehydrogenase-like Zn-dependent dehydrogenase
MSAHGALVRTVAVGVCGTDAELNAGILGRPPEGEELLVIGHESLGVVAEAGSRVKEIRRGDLVVAMVRRPDDCAACRSGDADLCAKGEYTERGIFGAHGFLSTHYADHEDYLVRIPPSLGDLGILLEPASVVVKALRHAGRIQQRMAWAPKRALVLGAGAVGLLAAFLLRLRGLKVDVYSREPRDSNRVALLEKADVRYHTRLPARDFDFVCEATGSPQVIAQGMERMAYNGIMAWLGVCPEESVTLPLGALNNRIVQRNQVIFGSVNANRSDFDQGVLDLQDIETRWPGLLRAMITRRVPFQRFAEALERTPDDIKVVIDVSEL